MSIFIIAEIGINHNGSLELAKQLIDAAKRAGADAVKFQRRTLERVYTKEELDAPRESPWGTTSRQQKEALEFSDNDFWIIDQYCRQVGIEWFFSAWDVAAQQQMKQFSCNYNKIASARITHTKLLQEVAKERKYTFISTGMATLNEIRSAIEIFKEHHCPYELMHCVSTYPAKPSDLNLLCIKSLAEAFQCKVGYSGHETGLSTTVAAAALGATSIERHLTLDRSMYGSDQAASVEPHGFSRLVRDIRVIESAMGNGIKTVLDHEEPIAQKLKRSADLCE